MRDELPTETVTNECGIWNLNKSNQEGSNWVAWIKLEDLNIYFDSNCNANPPKELVKYLGKNNLKITSEQFQGYNDPPICGHLCFNFIKNYKKYFQIIIFFFNQVSYEKSLFLGYNNF